MPADHPDARRIPLTTIPSMRHSHGGHGAPDYGRAFAIGIASTSPMSRPRRLPGCAASLALLADAGHNLGDVLGLGLSWGAAVLGRRGPSGRFTYGLEVELDPRRARQRVDPAVVTGGIAWEALWRLPTRRGDGARLAWVAAVGIAVNGGTALLFARAAGATSISGAPFCTWRPTRWSPPGRRRRHRDRLTGWLRLDPAVSLVVFGGHRLRHLGPGEEALGLALDAVPEGVDAAAVRAHLAAARGHGAARPPHLGHEHDRDGVDLPSGDAGGHPGDDALVAIAHELGSASASTTRRSRSNSATAAVCALTPEHVV